MAYRKLSEIRKLSRNANNLNIQKWSKWGSEISFVFDLFLDIAPVPEYDGKITPIQEFMAKKTKDSHHKKKLSLRRRFTSRKVAPVTSDVDESNESLSTNNKDIQSHSQDTKKEDDGVFNWTMFVDPVTLHFLPEGMEERYFRIMLLKNRVLMVRFLGLIGFVVSLLNLEVLSSPQFLKIWIIFLVISFFLALLAWIQAGKIYIEIAIKSNIHRLCLRSIEYLIIVGVALMDFHPEKQTQFAGTVTLSSFIYSFLISGLSGTYIESYCLLGVISIVPAIKFILFIIQLSLWHALVYLIPIFGIGITFVGFIVQGDRMRRISFLKTQLVEQQLQETTIEKSKTDYLLSVCLPRSIITRLKGKLTFDLIAQRFDETTVMFGDLKNFKQIAKSLNSMKEAVGLLNGFFSYIDETLPEFVTLEKIKTVSSKILLVGGLDGSTGHLTEMVDLSLRLAEHFKNPQTYTPENQDTEEKIHLDVAFGIAVGPMVAGIVGKKKFVYDVYGDVVNTASRMLSVSSKGQVIVAEDLWFRLLPDFDGECLGHRNIKGKGRIAIYHIIRRKSRLTATENHFRPTVSFSVRQQQLPVASKGIASSISRPGLNLQSLVTPNQVTAIHTSSSNDSQSTKKSGDRRTSIFTSGKKSSLPMDTSTRIRSTITATATGSFSVTNTGQESSTHTSSRAGGDTPAQVISVVNIEIPSTMNMNSSSRKASLQRRFSVQTDAVDDVVDVNEQLSMTKNATFPVAIPIIQTSFDEEVMEQSISTASRQIDPISEASQDFDSGSAEITNDQNETMDPQSSTEIKITLPDDVEDIIIDYNDTKVKNEFSENDNRPQSIPSLPEPQIIDEDGNLVQIIPVLDISDTELGASDSHGKSDDYHSYAIVPVIDVDDGELSMNPAVPIIDIDDGDPSSNDIPPVMISIAVPPITAPHAGYAPLPPLSNPPTNFQSHVTPASTDVVGKVIAEVPGQNNTNIGRPSAAIAASSPVKSKDMALEIIIRMLSRVEEDDDPETGTLKYMKVIYSEIDPYSLTFEHKVIEEEFRRDLVLATEARSGWRMIRSMVVIVLLLLSSFLFLSVSESVTPASSFTSSFGKIALSNEISLIIAGVHAVILIGLGVMAWFSINDDESSMPSFRRRVVQGILITILLIGHGVVIGLNWSNLWMIPLYMNVTVVQLLGIIVMRAEGLLIHHKAMLSLILLISLEGFGHYIRWSTWPLTISALLINCLWLIAFHRIERSTRIEYLIDLIMDTQAEIVLAEAQKSNMLINSILPDVVIKKLVTSPDSVVFESLKQISVLSMDIVGFTAMSSNKEPLTIVEMLNTAFTYFDYMSEAYNVEKITTIGDAYMACSAFTNAVDPRVGASQICLAALHMQNYIQKTLNLLPFVQKNFDKPVTIRIGIHSGLCYGAIMGGPRNFRYDVMGDTVEMADKVQEKCPPGSVLISESTRLLLEGNKQFQFSRFHDPDLEGPLWLLHFADEKIEDAQRNVDLSGPLKAASTAVNSINMRRLSMNVKGPRVASPNAGLKAAEPYGMSLTPPSMDGDYGIDLDADTSLSPEQETKAGLLNVEKEGGFVKRRATINM